MFEHQSVNEILCRSIGFNLRPKADDVSDHYGAGAGPLGVDRRPSKIVQCPCPSMHLGCSSFNNDSRRRRVASATPKKPLSNVFLRGETHQHDHSHTVRANVVDDGTEGFLRVTRNHHEPGNNAAVCDWDSS